jgi:hypothetical protein
MVAWGQERGIAKGPERTPGVLDVFATLIVGMVSEVV